jgi:hypothetical protein
MDMRYVGEAGLGISRLLVRQVIGLNYCFDLVLAAEVVFF